MNISGVNIHSFVCFTIIIFVSDETHARMPRNCMNHKHFYILRKWSKFQANGQKSSKSRLYLQDLLTLLGEQEINFGATSARVGILWLTEHYILRWGNGKRRATFLESHSFGLKKLTSCTVLYRAFKLIQTLSVTQLKVFFLVRCNKAGDILCGKWAFFSFLRIKSKMTKRI